MSVVKLVSKSVELEHGGFAVSMYVVHRGREYLMTPKKSPVGRLIGWTCEIPQDDGSTVRIDCKTPSIVDPLLN